MEKKLAVSRLISGILIVLLIIAAIVIWRDHQTISQLRTPIMQNISGQQDLIRADCTATDADSQARCGDDLQNLSDLLAKFSKQRYGTTTSATGVQGSVGNIQIQPLPTK